MLTLSPSVVKVACERIRDRLDGLATPSRLLRWSIGSIYLWFGALKLLNVSPAVPLIGDAFPLFIDGPLGAPRPMGADGAHVVVGRLHHAWSVLDFDLHAVLSGTDRRP